MKTLLLVGIGAGDPDYITYQAIKALRRSDVIFLMDKGAAKHKLNALRREICARFLDGHTPRFAEGLQPERERDAADYRASVDELNRDKQAVFEQLIDEQMADGGGSRRKHPPAPAIALRPAGCAGAIRAARGAAVAPGAGSPPSRFARPRQLVRRHAGRRRVVRAGYGHPRLRLCAGGCSGLFLIYITHAG